MNIKRNFAMCDNINNIQLHLLDFGHAQTGGEWMGKAVNPPYARLYYILGGDPYITVDGKHIPLEAGCCYLMPPGYTFRYACETSMEQLYFHINLTDYNGSDLLRCCRTMLECRPGIEKINELLCYSQSEDLFSGLMMRQEIYSSILSLVEKYGIRMEATHYSRCVVLAMEYIRRNLNLQLGISELAANSFVSESTLAKKFKTEVGMTIGSYIDDTILFEAEQLLLKSDLTVLQISERFGFCDQFYFSRRFKMKYGETPQKYRKMRMI